MRIYFGYDKRQVIQALRYHFISRPEIRVMLVTVNIFAIGSMILYFLHKITAMAFLVGSTLWIVLMVSFWFILPMAVYRRAVTFKHEFSMNFDGEGFSLEHERGGKTWEWSALKTYLESPHFLHLYFDSRSFLLVPKDGFKEKEQIAELREMLKTNIPKRKK